MPDVYLYAGEASPGDVILHDPVVPRGTFAGTAALNQAQTLSAVDVLLPWGVVLYPLGVLIAASSGGFVGAPVHPYVQTWRLV